MLYICIFNNELFIFITIKIFEIKIIMINRQGFFKYANKAKFD